MFSASGPTDGRLGGRVSGMDAARAGGVRDHRRDLVNEPPRFASRRVCASLLFIPQDSSPPPGMDFTPVPAGTLPDAALGMRGGDHDLEFSSDHVYAKILGNAHSLRNAPGANRRLAPYSACAGAITEFLVTADNAVLTAAVAGGMVINPARLNAAYNHYATQGGLAAAGQISDAEFRAEVEAQFAAIDKAAPHAMRPRGVLSSSSP